MKTRTTLKSSLQIFAIAALFVVGTVDLAAADVTPTTKDINIGVNDVYVPGGFDSHADSYVIANGLFPNGCYKWKTANVNHVDTFTHEVQPVATVSQGMCIMVLVPFSKEIRLGKLATGTHTLKFLNGDGTYLQKSMSIE
ncbi:MAG: hypothetical protein H7326_05070 [Bdellovibrionaceae bacterium]|nr:hypothetical protein [Pseudobdellovibrionaceae bacterium]